jgi:hypothetical protein
LSSAILYLAIVAIWAVVLVPRWLHPRPAQPEPVAAGEPMPATEPVPEAADDDGQELAGATPGDGPELVEGPGEPAPTLPSPAGRRADILRARRRMLTGLVVLTAGAVGLAVTGIAASWVIAPPAVLLGGFLVLLREAAHIDAERARRATGVHYAEAPPVAGQEPESFREEAVASADQAPVTASAPDESDSQPGAEVIDISARISDQVYDQYSDAAERAVGD